MGRRMQVFVAPGDEGRRLRIPASPWHAGRRVRLPRENWERVLDFADTVDAAAGALLRRVSRAPSPSGDDRVPATRAELRSLQAFLATLSAAAAKAPPLVPRATDEIPDAYTNGEHARMMDAVRAVVGAALAAGRPFRAWID